MNNTTISSNPFEGISILFCRTPGKTRLLKGRPRWTAKYDIDPARWQPQPGMESAPDLVGKGRTQEEAVRDLYRQVLILLEEKGYVARSSPVVSFFFGDTASNNAATFTFEA